MLLKERLNLYLVLCHRHYIYDSDIRPGNKSSQALAIESQKWSAASSLSDGTIKRGQGQTSIILHNELRPVRMLISKQSWNENSAWPSFFFQKGMAHRPPFIKKCGQRRCVMAGWSSGHVNRAEECVHSTTAPNKSL